PALSRDSSPSRSTGFNPIAPRRLRRRYPFRRPASNSHRQRRTSMLSLTVPPRGVFTTFMEFPLATDLDRLDAHLAIIGMPYGDPYSIDEVTNDQTNAPTAVR